MFKVNCGPTAYFDVDDTLVMWNTPSECGVLITINCRGYMENLAPNKHNIDLLIKMAKRGHAVIVWSQGGSDWAEAVVKALGIEEFVSVVTGKPTYFVDDLKDPKEWMGKHSYIDYNGKITNKDNHTKEN